MLSLTITDEAGRLPGGQGYVAQAAIGVVVAILEPLQVGLYDALEWEREVTTGAGAPQPSPLSPNHLFITKETYPFVCSINIY